MSYPLPDWLNYRNQSETPDLTAVCTGRPDLQAFLQQNPEWWISDEKNQTRPKALVLCEPTLQDCPGDVQDLIQQWLDQGIEVYVWHEDKDKIGTCQLVPLRQEFLAKLYGLKMPKNPDYEKINRAMLLRNKSRDQFIIIDTAQLQKIRTEITHALTSEQPGERLVIDSYSTQEEPPSNVHVDGIDFIGEDESLYPILRRTVEANPNLSQFSYATFQEDNETDFFESLSKNEQLFCNLRKACTLGTPVAFENIISRSSKLNYLECHADDFKDDSHIYPLWQNLQILSIRSNRQPNLLWLNSLAQCKNLKSFILHAFNYDDIPLQANLLPDLDSLEELSFAEKVAPQTILNFINKSKNLRSIDLSRYELLDNIKKDPRFKSYQHLFTDQTLAALNQSSQRTQINSNHHSPSSTSNRTPSVMKVTGPGLIQVNMPGDIKTDPDLSPAEYKADKIFYAAPGTVDPSLRHYRVNVFPHLDINQQKTLYQDIPFTLQKGPTDLVDCEQPTWEAEPGHLIYTRNTSNTKEISCYYGTFTLSATSDWQPLPSLSAEETLSSLHIEGINQHEVEIKYCRNANLYYIKSPHFVNKKDIHFNVQVPSSSVQVLPQELRTEIDYYRSFSGRSLHVKRGATGNDCLTAIHEQKVGACRHRAAAFKHRMDTLYPQYPTRIISNGIHQFIEIKYQNTWIRCDLGGYPSKLDVHSKNIPQPTRALPSGNIKVQADPTTVKSTSSHESPQREAKLLDAKTLEKLFITWQPEATQHLSLTELNQALLQHRGKNVLLNLSDGHTQAFQLALQQHCKNTHRPVYYIHSPKDLVCSANWIKRQVDNSGTLTHGPGGDLHDFVDSHRNDDPIIIVNWNTFTAQDIVKFNGIIDQKRFADGSEVPKNAVVIGLYDKNAPEAYTGADFYSRFDTKLQLPPSLSKSLTPHDCIEKTFTPAEDIADPEAIDLYHSSQWKSLLLGRWAILGKKLQFFEGPLLKAIREQKPIHLKNAPWHLPAFQLFWNQALLHGEFKVAGQSYTLPPATQYYQSNSYDWQRLNQRVFWQPLTQNPDQPVYILNPNSFGHFFTTYDFAHGEIHEQPGWLAQNKGKSMQIEITRNLTEAQWAQLLSMAEQQGVILNIHPKAKLTLPKEMKAVPSQLPPPLRRPSIIVSNDVDFTIATLEKSEQVRVIDISDFNSADIVIKQDAKWGVDQLSFQFDETVSEIFQALQSGDNIILKGHFSADLADTLAQVMNEHAYVPEKLKPSSTRGKLTLVSDSAEHFELLPHQVHQANPTQKREALVATYGESIVDKLGNRIDKNSYVKLETMAKFLTVNPSAAPEEAWLGLTYLPAELQPSFGTVVWDLSLAAYKMFSEVRFQQVHHALQQAPYVFIAGPTGSGKSTFIQDTLKNSEHYAVYFEEKGLINWAQDKSDKIKVLFIDEANIGSANYAKFEGLFDNPPWMLINQKIVPLTANHKVIFAGNPLSYAGERHLPSLFDRHANSIVFSPLPPAYLYHAILKPLLTDLQDESLAHEISNLFINTYQTIVGMNADTVLMSPRELEMMALSVMSAYPASREQLRAKAYTVAFQMAQDVLPHEMKSEFESKFQTLADEIPPYHRERPPTVGKFILTASRYEAYDRMSDFLNIRRMQQNTSNKNAQYAGLGGITFEGEPGTGKSRFVKQMLVNEGFQQRKLNSSHPPLNPQKLFYCIPVSMPLQEKKAVLAKAFNEGAIVLIDELNSSASMEKLMNAMLMGRDLDNNRPKPGFKLIGTENPISYKGRKARSIALQRRLVKCEFSEYPMSELIEIIANAGLDLKRSEQVCTEYLAKRKFALETGKNPIPTFRDLIKTVDEIVEAESRSYQDLLTAAKAIAQTQENRAPLSPKAHQPAQEKERRAAVISHQLKHEKNEVHRRQIELNAAPPPKKRTH